MGPFEYIMIYVISWWMVLFMVLPFKAGLAEAPEGHEYPSAPAKSYLKIKLFVTSALALLVTIVLSYLMNNGIITLWLPYRF